MAINDHPDVRCFRERHHPEDAPPAVAFKLGDTSGVWRPVCAPCVQDLIDDPTPIPYLVILLDPTRQRRPDPDHHDVVGGDHDQPTHPDHDHPGGA